MEYELQALTEGREPVATPLVASDLDAYRMTFVALPSLVQNMQEHIDRLVASDPAAAECKRRLESARDAVTLFEERAAAALSPAARQHLGTVKLEACGVAITWQKPAERWHQSVTPKSIAETDADLAKRLGIYELTAAPAKPIIRLVKPR